MSIYENPTDYTQDPYTNEQLTTAANAAGIDPQTLINEYNQNVAESQTTATQASSSSSSTVQNPSWIYAVNMPSTYPDFAAMKAAGSGLVIADDDPNLRLLLDAAKQWGIPVAVNVAAPPGITPEAYAARVAQAQQYGLDKIVLDMEAPAKGYEGSEGWNWAQKVADLLRPIVSGTSVAVTMEANQADYNYQAFKNLSGQTTDFWVQSYQGDMNGVDPGYATGPAQAANAGNVIAILAPGQAPPTNYTGGYVSYGIPTTGASAAGVYGTGTAGAGAGQSQTSNTPYYPGQQPIAGAGSGETPGPPIYVNPNAPSGGHTTSPTTPPPPHHPAANPNITQNPSSPDWASAYFSSFGLPADIAAKVDEIFTQNPDDTQKAIDLALAYIRGTSWYAQTFPGIQYGMQHGLITNEQDYRQYVTALDTLAQRYLGRHISGDEVTNYLYNGLTPEIIGKQYEGQANLEANFPDYAYYLRNFGDEKNLDTDAYRALANEQVGLDSALGQRINRAFQGAMARYQTLFKGDVGTPSLSLGKTGLSAPSLQGNRGAPDIGA